MPSFAVKNCKKVKSDYSEESVIYSAESDSLHTVFRVTNKTPLTDGWTLALQFAEPQKFAIQSADVDFSWNCKYTILTARPKDSLNRLIPVQTG